MAHLFRVGFAGLALFPCLDQRPEVNKLREEARVSRGMKTREEDKGPSARTSCIFGSARSVSCGHVALPRGSAAFGLVPLGWAVSASSLTKASNDLRQPITCL